MRVAFVAGSLTQGGAEKQLLYMARALRERHVDLRVFSLTRGEFHEGGLQRACIDPIWVGRHGHPLARLLTLARVFARWRPHIIQSTHFFGNLYAAILGRVFGALSVGSIRNDGYFDVRANGRWGPWLLSTPPVLLANSAAARHNAAVLGVPKNRTYVLSNVIDLVEFDRKCRWRTAPDRPAGPVAIAVCRVVPAKRLDRFVHALALARRDVPALRGIIVGDGPERGPLQELAKSLGGLDEALTFVGRSDDVPALLARADMLVLTSDHEGFPNVVLEAMAAGLPVVATPAGDVRRIVERDVTGYVVPFDGIDAIAQHMVRLATSEGLRTRLGNAGRARVERLYSYHTLGDRLLDVYRRMAESQRNSRTLAVIPAELGLTPRAQRYARGISYTTQ